MALRRGQRRREKPDPRTTGPKKLARGQCDGVRTFTSCPHMAVSEIPSAAHLPSAQLLQTKPDFPATPKDFAHPSHDHALHSVCPRHRLLPRPGLPALPAGLLMPPPPRPGLRLDATAASQTILFPLAPQCTFQTPHSAFRRAGAVFYSSLCPQSQHKDWHMIPVSDHK